MLVGDRNNNFFPTQIHINQFVDYGAKEPALIFRAWAARGVNISRDVNLSKR